MLLKDFMALPHQFRWGGIDGDDCMTFCASWVQFAIGQDPAGNFRGTYSTEKEARRLIKSHGGLKSFSAELLSPFGFSEVKQPIDGDIGIVRVPFGDDGKLIDVAAIRFGPLWLMLSEKCLVAKRADCSIAWSLPR